jgi:hypothetical protein
MNKYEQVLKDQNDQYQAGPKRPSVSKTEQPVITEQKPIALMDLPEADRTRVLEIMIDGINSGLDFLIHGRAHQYFLAHLHNGMVFDPSVLWDSLPISSQNHFKHAREAIKIIEALAYPAETDRADTPRVAPPQNEGGKKQKRKG